MIKLGLPWRVVLGLLLGAATTGIIYLIHNKFPSSRIVANITDVASFPALLIAWIIYPGGVHTDGGAPYYGYAFLGAHILFYTVVWFVILSWISRRGRRAAAGKQSE